jgi:hypothetical protein
MRKRIWLPLFFVIGLAGALATAVMRSDTSRIIVYNETGAMIPALRLTACGQEKALTDIGADESFRWKLRPMGTPGEIFIETAANPTWQWRGGYIKPHGGYRVIIRLLGAGEVEVQTEVSIWQRLLPN